MKLFSVQDQRVIDTIMTTGEYHVKRKFIVEKYGEVSSIMFHAYDWFVKFMSEHIDKPKDAEYPVWHSVDAKYLYQGYESHLIQLDIPDCDVLLFDNHGWERVLQMNYVGLCLEDEEVFDRQLNERGISNGCDAFLSPHYPSEKYEIMRSWERIFDVSSTKAVRGASWYIKRDWVIERERYERANNKMD